MEEEREEREIEENYKYDSKPLPVSLIVKLSTNVELFGCKAFPHTSGSVTSFPGHLPSTSKHQKVGWGLETSLQLQDKMGKRLNTRSMRDMYMSESLSHDCALSSLLQVNLLMSELEFDDSPAAQREYNRLFWQANIV